MRPLRPITSSMLSDSGRRALFWRISSMSLTNCKSRVPPAPLVIGTARYRLIPCVRAVSCRLSSVRAPMPRAGKFTTRRKAPSSSGFSISRR